MIWLLLWLSGAFVTDMVYPDGGSTEKQRMIFRAMCILAWPWFMWEVVREKSK